MIYRRVQKSYRTTIFTEWLFIFIAMCFLIAGFSALGTFIYYKVVVFGLFSLEVSCFISIYFLLKALIYRISYVYRLSWLVIIDALLHVLFYIAFIVCIVYYENTFYKWFNMISNVFSISYTNVDTMINFFSLILTSLFCFVFCVASLFLTVVFEAFNYRPLNNFFEGYTFSNFHPKYFNEIYRILRYHDLKSEFSYSSLRRLTHYWCNDNIRVVSVNGKIVGFYTFLQDYIELQDFYVDFNYRDTGVEELMIKDFEKIAFSMHNQYIYITVNVMNDPDLLHFFHDWDFKKVGDIVTLRKKLF